MQGSYRGGGSPLPKLQVFHPNEISMEYTPTAISKANYNVHCTSTCTFCLNILRIPLKSTSVNSGSMHILIALEWL